MTVNDAKEIEYIQSLVDEMRSAGISGFNQRTLEFLNQNQYSFSIKNIRYFFEKIVPHNGEWLAPDWLYNFIVSILKSRNVKSCLDPAGGFGILAASLNRELTLEQYDVVSNNKEISDLYSFLGIQGTTVFPGSFLGKNEINSFYDAVVTFPPMYGRNNSVSCSIEDKSVRISGLQYFYLLLEKSKKSLNCEGLLISLVPSSYLQNIPNSENLNQYIDKIGLSITASFRVPPRTFSTTNTPLELVIFERKQHSKMFIAEIPEKKDAQTQLVERFNARVEGTRAIQGILIDNSKYNGYNAVIAEETSKRLGKKYRLKEILLNNVIVEVNSQKKSKSKYIPFEEHPDAVYLPVTGKRNAVISLNKIPEGRTPYLQLIINRDNVYPEYFAHYLNSTLGHALRDMLMLGAAIPRISTPSIRNNEISIYLDDLQGQHKTINALQKLEVLKSELSEIESRIDNRSRKIDTILDDLDHINHEELFKDWVETLPFPLASILRAYYTVDQNDKEKYERLLYFFEALAVFYATIHISACRPIPEIWTNARSTISAQLKKQHLSLSTASFGVWKIIIEVLTSTIRKGLADKEKCDYYSQIYCVNNPLILEKLCSAKLVQVIQDSNKYRNRWKGHGGSISPNEAKFRHETLSALLNDYRSDVGTLFSNFLLIEPNVGRTLPGPIHQYSIKKIIGSNVLMETDTIILTEPVVSDQLCFYCPDNNRALMLDKFFLMRNTPQSACYFYNRIEQTHPHYVSYHVVEESEVEENGNNQIFNELISEFSKTS